MRPPFAATNAVTIWMIGGLGNQMFQYAAGKTLAKSLDVPLRISTYDYRRPGRPYLLPKLSIAETATDFDPVFKRAPAKLTKTAAGTRALNTGARLGLWPTLYREDGHNFDPGFSALRAPVELRGYFMSERYFAAERDLIVSSFAPSVPLSLAAGAVLQDIRSRPVSVAVHVRGGDFLSPGAPPMLGLNYYTQAIKQIEAVVSTPADYFVFTDDVPHAKTVLPANLAATICELPDDQPWEDMLLMAQCSHNIIANSSFSWWGAWLNQKAHRVVVAPKNMLPGSALSQRTPDLYPPDWITIHA
jgi:Glycosyl transferase family 11